MSEVLAESVGGASEAEAESVPQPVENSRDEEADIVAPTRTAAAAPTSSLSLPQLFRKAEHTFKQLDSLSGEKLSAACQQSIADFENCNRYVKTLALFSDNEEVEDISTSHLKYLLVHYYLHQLLPRDYAREPAVRDRQIRHALLHATAFLEICQQYHLLNPEQVKRWDAAVKGDGKVPEPQREERIAAFRRERELEQKLEQLELRTASAAGSEQVDEEEERLCFLTKLELAIAKTFSQVSTMHRELEMLSFRLKMDREAGEGGATHEDHRMCRHAAAHDPNRKGISVTQISAKMEITREEIRANVFKPFHNLPTMSLAEFADLEVANAMERQERQKDGEAKRVKNYAELEEAGEEDNEELVDAAVYKDRAWDNWKDDNPRGSGITKKY